MRKRTGFAILFMLLLATEILIGMYAIGWVRNYLGDVLVVILLYAFANLIHTDITKAKKVLVMVGTKKALAYAVRNVTVTKKNTLLKERFLNRMIRI